jgi:putative glycosyltransferase (TIGR04372 family)
MLTRLYLSNPIFAKLYLPLLAVRIMFSKVKEAAPHLQVRSRRSEAGLPLVVRLVEHALARSTVKGAPWMRHVRIALMNAASSYMVAGNLYASRRCYELVLAVFPHYSQSTLAAHRLIGVTHFLQGGLREAQKAIATAGEIRRVLLAGLPASSKFRTLAQSWLAAFGHIATLDFYFKKRILGWGDSAPQLLVLHETSQVPGKVLFHQFAEKGIAVIHGREEFERLSQCRLDDEQHDVLEDDFWDHDFGKDGIHIYTHAAAKIQQRWEQEKRPPNMTLSAAQLDAGRAILRQLHVPDDAWFVCLHVRESGFHARWNDRYPSARDARIEDYLLAARTITERGGWVIRMGDTSMRRLPKLERVVDYAHSPSRCELGDIVLTVRSSFLLGTNSGFATVPGIYGTPNVLTNWVPVGLPLWFGQDLMIPKLFWDDREGRNLSFEELFGSRLGYMQNVLEFPPHIEIRPNTPEEIREVAIEMLDRLDGKLAYSAADEKLQQRYFDVAVRHGSYRGSRIGKAFLERNSALLPGPAAAAETATVRPIKAVA